MQGIRDVYFFIDTLLEEFRAHSGNDGETPKMEAILGKDSTVPRFTGVQITKRALLCVRRLTAFVTAILQGVIKIDTAGDGRDVAQQSVVVAHAGIDALCVIRP